MIDKITIPGADGVGECGDCPLLVQCSDGSSHCYVGIAEAEYPVNCSPGTECIPGDYALLPVDEFAALRAEVGRLRAAMTRSLELMMFGKIGCQCAKAEELIAAALAGKEKA
jgi:hypothetical protein